MYYFADDYWPDYFGPDYFGKTSAVVGVTTLYVSNIIGASNNNTGLIGSPLRDLPGARETNDSGYLSFPNLGTVPDNTIIEVATGYSQSAGRVAITSTHYATSTFGLAVNFQGTADFNMAGVTIPQYQGGISVELPNVQLNGLSKTSRTVVRNCTGGPGRKAVFYYGLNGASLTSGVLRNFEMSNSEAGFDASYADNLTLEGCFAHTNETFGIGIGEASDNLCLNFLIDDCDAHQNGTDSSDTLRAGINIWGSAGIIQNCRADENGRDGFDIGVATAGGNCDVTLSGLNVTNHNEEDGIAGNGAVNGTHIISAGVGSKIHAHGNGNAGVNIYEGMVAELPELYLTRNNKNLQMYGGTVKAPTVTITSMISRDPTGTLGHIYENNSDFDKVPVVNLSGATLYPTTDDLTTELMYRKEQPFTQFYFDDAVTGITVGAKDSVDFAPDNEGAGGQITGSFTGNLVTTLPLSIDGGAFTTGTIAVTAGQTIEPNAASRGLYTVPDEYSNTIYTLSAFPRAVIDYGGFGWDLDPSNVFEENGDLTPTATQQALIDAAKAAQDGARFDIIDNTGGTISWEITEGLIVTAQDTGAANTPGTITNAATIQLYEDGVATLTASFDLEVLAGEDTTPGPFTFTDLIGQELNSGPYRGIGQVTDVDAGVLLQIINGELSNNGGATWTTSNLTAVVGQTFARTDELTASGLELTAVSVTTSVNGVSDTFSVTTRSLVPPVFSGTIPAQSWQVGVPVSLDLNTYYNPVATSFTLSQGTLPNGVSLSGSVISGTPLDPATGVLQYSGTNADGSSSTNAFNFTVAAAVADVTPNAPSFTPILNAVINNQYQVEQLITGMDYGEVLTVTGTGLELSNDGVNYSASVTSSATSRIRITLTAGTEPGTTYTASGTVNGVTVTYSVTTSGAATREITHLHSILTKDRDFG